MLDALEYERGALGHSYPGDASAELLGGWDTWRAIWGYNRLAQGLILYVLA